MFLLIALSFDNIYFPFLFVIIFYWMPTLICRQYLTGFSYSSKDAQCLWRGLLFQTSFLSVLPWLSVSAFSVPTCFRWCVSPCPCPAFSTRILCLVTQCGGEKQGLFSVFLVQFVLDKPFAPGLQGKGLSVFWALL